MKKLFTLALALLASFSLWAVDYYTPTADEVIILNDVYDKNATEAGYSTHAAIAWGGTVSFSDKKAGDPNNNGEATSSNVKTCSVKGNGSGKDLTVSFEGCSQIIVYHEKQSSRYVELRAGSKTGDLLGKSVGNTYFTAVDLNANNSYSIFLHGVKDNGDDQDFYIYAVKLIKGETCDDPEAHLAFTKSIAFVGEQFSYDFGSKNGGALTTTYTLNDAPAEQGTDYTFSSGNLTVLKAGQFVMRMTIDAQDGYCAVDVSDTILINEATPVASVTIAGPTAGYAGYTLTYTAEAENATTYEWYVDGVAANNNSATFNYTAVKGNHAIKATATNKFTTTPVESNTINVAVSSLYGEIITFIAETGSSNINKDVVCTGIVGGTAHQNTYKNAKLGENGKYISLTLASGSFAAGDTAIIVVTPEGDQFKVPSTLKLASDVNNTTFIGEVSGLSASSADDITAKIVLTASASTIYLSRTSTFSQNPIVKSISVVRPMPVKSTVETLTAVSVNEVAISTADLATLQADHAVALTASYAAAPKVAFTKHIVITYEDDSQKESDAVIEVTAEENAGGKWEAKATINAIEYVVTAEQEASATITYMDGENKLGEEVVAVGAHPAEFAQYQSKSLATFVAWYSDAALENAVTIGEAVITQDTTFYAKFENAYATSVNFEKIVMQNSKGYAIIPQLGTQHYASNITGSLDSLNNSKSDSLRNYAYLGLKVKQNGALLNFRLAKDNTVKIKFGNVAKTPQASINGGGYANITITDSVYTYNAEEDALISIKMMDGNAVVFQQIMIGEDLQAPELYDIKYTTTNDHGTISGVKMGIPGETIKVYENRKGGWKLHTITVNEEVIEESETTSIFEFIMPNAVANVSGTFEVATSLDNTDAANKAIKAIENGQIVIIKNGVRYNVLGAVLK